MRMRLQKIISMSGFCSRRKAEDIIREGRVTVNGQRVSIGASAELEKDIICVDRKRITFSAKKYYAFSKPRGYLSSLVPHFGKKPISIFFPNEYLFPVGRLDFITEGLMLLTNDGDFANKVMHPRYEVEKEYQVTVDKPLTQDVLEKITGGIVIEGRKVSAKVKPQTKTIIAIVLHEGRKHIVKKLFVSLGYRVLRLVRVRINGVLLRNLSPGKYRLLTTEEKESCLKPSLRKG